MPFLDQFVIASTAAQTGGNAWDLSGASWDAILTDTVPVRSDFAVLVSVLLAPEEAVSDHVLTVTLHGPDGSPVGGMRAQIGAATEEQLQARPWLERWRSEAVLETKGAVFPEHGRYELHIDWDEEPLREPLVLHVIRPGEA